MSENTQANADTAAETQGDDKTTAKGCCGSAASEPVTAKPKDLSKYDYRHKAHGEAATRRKGCC
jgi:hypothetical protein